MSIIRKIDRNSSIPLYSQLESILMEQISSGILKPYDAIPSEFELMNQYKLSRFTVRQAIARLVKEGFLYSVRGKGTFVSRPRERFNVLKLKTFSEIMSMRGMRSYTKQLGIEVIPCSKTIASKLNLVAGEPIYRMSTLCFGDGSPICIETAFISEGLLSGIDFSQADEQHTLSEFIVATANFNLHEADEIVQSILAWSEEASLLQISPGSPMMHHEKIIYSDNETPLINIQYFFRADRYTLEFRTYRS